MNLNLSQPEKNVLYGVVGLSIDYSAPLPTNLNEVCLVLVW